MIASDSRTVTGRGGRVRGVLVVGEVATAVLLLFGAGLLLRTLMAVEGVDRGYRAERVLTMMVDPLGSRYPTAASLLQFFDAVEQEVTRAARRPQRGVGERAAAGADRRRSVVRDRRRPAGATRASAPPPTTRS